MIKYTARYINIVSLIITIIIFCLIMKTNVVCNKFDFNPQKISILLRKNIVKVAINSNNINKETKETNLQKQNKKSYKETNWKLKIPEISLEAEISESTDKETMDKFIGHFEETSKTLGNIGLAAHNRGYSVNYFSDIKKLKKGSEIIYQYYNFEKTYIVIENKIIKDTDWEDLKETKENRITLITCVENEPEYRRCIKGIEKN